MSGYTDEDFLSVIDYLSNERPDVKEMALEGILPLCAESDFLVFLRKKDHSAKLIRPLLRLIGGAENLSTLAAATLVNISDTAECAGAMITLNAVDRLVDNLKNQLTKQAPLHEHLNLMILANLTQHRDGRYKLLQLHESEAVRGSHLLILLGLFKRPIQKSEDREYEDRYLWVSHILCNLSTDKDGRHYAVDKLGVDGLLDLADALKRFDRPERREMILRVIRNLFADKVHHKVLGAKDSLILDEVLCMVYPPKGDEIRNRKSMPAAIFTQGQQDTRTMGQKALAGPVAGEETMSPFRARLSRHVDNEAFGIVKAQNLRALVCDLLADCCMTPEGREALRRRGAYEIIRVWHLEENDQQIKDAIEEYVHLVHYEESELEEQDKEIERKQEEEQEKMRAIARMAGGELKIEEIDEDEDEIEKRRIREAEARVERDRVMEEARIKKQIEAANKVIDEDEEAAKIGKLCDEFDRIELELQMEAAAAAEMNELD